MDEFDFPVDLAPAEEGGFVVTFPDVPEAITQGDDKNEALHEAIDALEAALSFYVNAGEDLPRPKSRQRGQVVVRPSTNVLFKLGIYQAMRRQGVRKTDLAKRLGVHPPQVDRILDLGHVSKLAQLEEALRVLSWNWRTEFSARQVA